ncbi:hypothetical protein NPIL_330251 [Nephila pilipes]|uniref:Uncharacterized protein n=1 Tax=Nephila pilipes TaxID=299642 RepID=A0A8X6QHI6_NEPPI|nr:hypothetical protein NPIL_330251 [Nephila pilipes]
MFDVFSRHIGEGQLTMSCENRRCFEPTTCRSGEKLAGRFLQCSYQQDRKGLPIELVIKVFKRLSLLLKRVAVYSTSIRRLSS